jgi:hypothetical protein
MVKNRPAESGGVASALGLLLAYILGIKDVELVVALGVAIGFVPAAITWLVVMIRGERGYSLVEALVIVFLALLVVLLLLAVLGRV